MFGYGHDGSLVEPWSHAPASDPRARLERNSVGGSWDTRSEGLRCIPAVREVLEARVRLLLDVFPEMRDKSVWHALVGM